MEYTISFKATARKRLGTIPQQDRERILKKIISLASNPHPPGSIKLTNNAAYRIRQGDYRIIYTVDNGALIIEVIRIGHRRDVNG